VTLVDVAQRFVDLQVRENLHTIAVQPWANALRKTNSPIASPIGWRADGGGA
jgi:hypothetical protein